jgi:hypothetical protein
MKYRTDTYLLEREVEIMMMVVCWQVDQEVGCNVAAFVKAVSELMMMEQVNMNINGMVVVQVKNANNIFQIVPASIDCTFSFSV